MSEFDIPQRGGRWPRLRLNGVAVASYPSSCRVVDCEIDGTAEVRQVVADAKVAAVAHRRKDGVIAFGRDDDLLQAFRGRDPKLGYGRLDVMHAADIGLLYDALLAALVRQRPLVRRGRRVLTVDPARANDSALDPLKRAGISNLTGRIPNTGGAWSEGVELRLEQRHGALWLIYAPTVWSDRAESDKAENDRRREWTRERQVKRYNRPYTAILKGWADVICGSKKESTLLAIGLDRGGTDAEFVVKRLAPFAERSAS